ncbi:MAG: hypothetical protein QXU26_02105 [Thermofilaceae archaeon]
MSFSGGAMVIADRALLAAVLLSVAVASLSTYLHYPAKDPPLGIYGLQYSDIDSIFRSLVFEAVEFAGHRALNVTVTVEVDGVWVALLPSLHRWYSAEVVESFASTRGCYAPYLHYGFEYPPLVGVLWYVSTCLAYTSVLPEAYTADAVVESLDRMVVIHYTVHAAVLSICLVVSAMVAVKLADELGVPWRRALLFLLLPSTTIYAVYNWDLLAVTLLLLSLYSYVKRRYLASGVLLGLSASSKLLPAVVGFALLMRLVGEAVRGEVKLRAVAEYLAGCVVGGAPILAWISLAPQGFSWAVNYVSGWFCENCLYNVFLLNEYSHLHKLLFISLSTPIVLLVGYLSFKEKRVGVEVIASAVLLSVTVLNYIFTPQMVLLLTPVLLLAVPKTLYPLVVVADASNTMIILTLFNRDWVESLGVQEPLSPFHAASVVQMFANIRNLLLLISMALLLYRCFSNTSLKLRAPASRR